MVPSVGDLRTIALFSRSSDAELAELARLFEAMERSERDVVLFDIGQPADAMYLFTEGVAMLESPEDDVHHLHPPALLGELGALTGMPRSTKVTVRNAVCYRVDALQWQQFLFEHHGVGLRVLRDVLRVAAEKIHRDQVRMGTMRQLSQWTQSELKDVVTQLAAMLPTPSLVSVRTAVDALILRNRRLTMRVEPSPSMPATLTIEHGTERVTTSGIEPVVQRLPAVLLELSRTHLSFSCEGATWGAGAHLAGTLNLASRALPIAGRVIRSQEGRVTMVLDAMDDEHAAPLDGYLTRAQLLDILL